MPRRLLVAILLLSYLSGQVAAIPHGHDHMPAEHHQHAHLHVGWLVHWLSDGSHDDSHHPHRHHSHDGGSEHEHSHDDDSIDLPTFVATADREARSADPPERFVDLLTVVFAGCESVSPEARIQASSHTHGKTPGSGCALYLTLRTLRI